MINLMVAVTVNPQFQRKKKKFVLLVQKVDHLKEAMELAVVLSILMRVRDIHAAHQNNPLHAVSQRTRTALIILVVPRDAREADLGGREVVQHQSDPAAVQVQGILPGTKDALGMDPPVLEVAHCDPAVSLAVGDLEVVLGNQEAIPGHLKLTPCVREVVLEGLEAAQDYLEADPGCQEVAPGGLEADPGDLEASPGDPEVAPGGLEAALYGLEVDQGVRKAAPDDLEVDPSDREAAPGDPEVDLCDREAAPGDLEAAPDYLEVDPDAVEDLEVDLCDLEVVHAAPAVALVLDDPEVNQALGALVVGQDPGSRAVDQVALAVLQSILNAAPNDLKADLVALDQRVSEAVERTTRGARDYFSVTLKMSLQNLTKNESKSQTRTTKRRSRSAAWTKPKLKIK